MEKYVYIKISYGCLYIVVCSLLFRQSKGNSIVVTNTSGIITSPNYPSDYNNDLDCEYIIQSPTKQPITLVFEDFDIEDDDDCTNDYVSVKDGANILLGTFCGDNIPYPLLALSGVIILKFHSNNEDSEKGFRAVFNDSQECVYVTKDSNGTIQSPNYPDNYPKNTICLYYIESRKGVSINMTFTHFVLEYTSRRCPDDYVLVRDGLSQSSKLIGKFCGSRIPIIPVLLTGTVFIIFRSDNSVSWSGFKAKYEEEPFLDCSGFLKVSLGRIQSPKHPEKYDYNTDCVYTLASQFNGLINLTFTFFEMEKADHGNCIYDFVEIYDSNTSIGKFCGSQKPVLTFILSSSVRVHFHSDDSKNYRGFSANYAEITVDQTTDEVLTTVSFFPTSGNMWNNKFTPFTNTSSVSPVVIGAATGGLIGLIAVITIICVIIGHMRRTETNRIKRNHPKEPTEKPCHVYNNVVNIDHCSTSNSVECCMENANTNMGKEINIGDAEMNEEGIANDEINTDYSYSNLLTDDTLNSYHNAESSYYNLSDSNNGEHEIQTVIKTSPKVKTDDSEYMDQGEAYNILNIHPQKINDTEHFDRTIEDVYDKTTYDTNTRSSDVGLYDHTSNNLK